MITEHDYQWEPDELAELAARAAPLRVLSGAEISAREGHFLVYGLPSLEEAPPGILVADLLKVVRRHEAAIVAAHPFRWDQPFDEIVAEHGPVFDALELVSNNVSPGNAASRPRLCSVSIPWERPARATPTSSTSSAAISPSLSSPSIRSPTSWRQPGNRRGRPRHRPGAYLSSGPVG